MNLRLFKQQFSVTSKLSSNFCRMDSLLFFIFCMFPGENGIKFNEEKRSFTSMVTKSSKHGFHSLKVQQKNYISAELLEILFLFCGANKTELFRKKYLLLHIEISPASLVLWIFLSFCWERFRLAWTFVAMWRIEKCSVFTVPPFKRVLFLYQCDSKFEEGTS